MRIRGVVYLLAAVLAASVTSAVTFAAPANAATRAEACHGFLLKPSGPTTGTGPVTLTFEADVFCDDGYAMVGTAYSLEVGRNGHVVTTTPIKCWQQNNTPIRSCIGQVKYTDTNGASINDQWCVLQQGYVRDNTHDVPLLGKECETSTAY